MLAVAIAVPVAVAAESGSTGDHPLLEEARANVADVTARLDAAQGDRAAAEEALAAADAQLVTVEAAVNEAADAVRRQEQEVAAAAERLDRLRSEAEDLERLLEDRSVRLFMSGGAGGLDSLLGAGDVQEAFERSSYLDLVVTSDQVDLETAVTARRALAAETTRFEAETARLERMRDQREGLLGEVEELRTARAEALGEAEREVDDLERLQDDLDEDYARIEELIEASSSTPVAASPPSSAGYSWPVCNTVTSYYGYRWGRQHKGIDIAGNTGDAIGAAKAGVVIAAGYEGGYGNLVLVDHGDGVVTAYAHQSEVLVAPGQPVVRGERIGSVGSTGNSTGPHLHFETRVNGTAVDPMQYLPDGC